MNQKRSRHWQLVLDFRPHRGPIQSTPECMCSSRYFSLGASSHCQRLPAVEWNQLRPQREQLVKALQSCPTPWSIALLFESCFKHPITLVIFAPPGSLQMKQLSMRGSCTGAAFYSICIVSQLIVFPVSCADENRSVAGIVANYWRMPMWKGVYIDKDVGGC